MDPAHRAPGGGGREPEEKRKRGGNCRRAVDGAGGTADARVARGVGPPGQGVGAWRRVSRAGATDVSGDMDRAGGIADFTRILDQPTPAGAGRWGYSVFGLAVVRSGFLRCTAGRGAHRGSWWRRWLSRGGSGGWPSLARRCSGIECSGLASVTGLNSSKSITYITRLAQRIIGACPDGVGRYLQPIFPGFPWQPQRRRRRCST